MSVIEGVFTDEDLAALRSRNRDRARAARKSLGTKYALHPINSPTRVGGRPQPAHFTTLKRAK